MLSYARKLIVWLGGTDLVILLSVFVVVVGLWCFVALAYAVRTTPRTRSVPNGWTTWAAM
jgi:hypothetical protein